MVPGELFYSRLQPVLPEIYKFTRTEDELRMNSGKIFLVDKKGCFKHNLPGGFNES